MEAFHDGYRLWLKADPGFVLVEGESPLYRAPAEAGSSFITEPRRRPDV